MFKNKIRKIFIYKPLLNGNNKNCVQRSGILYIARDLWGYTKMLLDKSER